MTPEQLRALDAEGYIIVPAALDPAWIARLHQAFASASTQQGGTVHVEITDATPERAAWIALETHPALLETAWRVLGTRDLVFGAHGRDPLPGFGQQGLHADWGPRAPGAGPFVFTALWMLDPFTVENGATRVVPGSHRLYTPISKSLSQPLARHPQERVLTGAAGSVILMNGHLWHSARRNESRGSRRTVQMVGRVRGS